MKRVRIVILSVLILFGGMHLCNYVIFQFADFLSFRFENYFWDMNDEGDSQAVLKRISKICAQAQSLELLDKTLIDQAGMKKVNLKPGQSIGYVRELSHWRRLGTVDPEFFITHPSVSVFLDNEGNVRNCLYAYDAAVTAAMF